MQTTFMMLKPDAFAQKKDEAILDVLTKHGLRVMSYRKVKVDMEVMKTLLSHYQEVIDKMDSSFNFVGKLFNSFYYHGPHYIMPMKIEYQGDEDIITLTRELVGKTNPQEARKESIRGKYSDDNYEKAENEKRLVNNLIHASDSHQAALKELKIWASYLKK